MKKTFLALTVFLFLFMGLDFGLVWGAGIRMWLTPTQTEYPAGQEFVVTLNLDSDGQKVVSADARLSFNPGLMQVRSVEGGLADFSYIDNYDNTAGRVVISAIMNDIFSDGVVVNGAFAKITFISQASGVGSLQLIFDAQDKQEDSSVATLSGVGDQLASVGQASYTFVDNSASVGVSLAPSPLPEPTAVPTLPPTPTTKPDSAVTPTLALVPTAVPTLLSSGVSQLPNSGAGLATEALFVSGVLFLLAGARFALIKA